MKHARHHDSTWIATLVGTAGLALTVLYAHDRMRGAVPPEPVHRRVRDAGPEHMKLRPLSWDLLDETNDASFPASDPPGNY